MKVVRSVRKLALFLVVMLAAGSLSGCGALVKKATQPMIDDLSASVMKQQDIDLVRDGAPAFLLFLDGLIESSPEDPDTLRTAAQLYSAYVSAFLLGENLERAKLMSAKARRYAFTAMSVENEVFAQLYDKPYEQFLPILDTIEPGDEDALFLVISTWATYIQAHSDSWDNIADIAKVEALTRKLLDLDETYYYGSGHLLMGVLKSLLPAAMGGKPEQAKVHFERAIEISDGRFLPAYVFYAKQYAKLTFNRELHDQLLGKVMEAPVDRVPELTLINAMAKRQADDLLKEADEYF